MTFMRIWRLTLPTLWGAAGIIRRAGQRWRLSRWTWFSKRWSERLVQADWRRIAGLHVQDDGVIGVVWLARDLVADVTHLYDCALFRREVDAVIGEGISARGKWIPVAWHKDAE